MSEKESLVNNKKDAVTRKDLKAKESNAYLVFLRGNKAAYRKESPDKSVSGH